MLLDKGWQKYIGIAVADKEKNSPLLKVHIQELSPSNGEVKVDESFAPIKIKNEKGEKRSGKISVQNYITATSFNTTNWSIPEVRLGEQVELYHHCESDIFYWRSLGRDDRLRPTEKRVFMISDSGNRNEEVHRTNSYGIIFSSNPEDQYVELYTSDSNGEQFKYRVRLDGHSSNLKIEDSGQNKFIIHSEEPMIEVENRDGTFAKLKKEDLLVNAFRQIILNTPLLSLNVDSGDAVSVLKSVGINLTAKDTFMVNAPSIGLNGTLVTDTIYAKHVIGGSFSTGSAPMYSSASIDEENGEGSQPHNAPASGGLNSSRHSCAYEQMQPCIFALADEIEKLGGDASAARAHVTASIMPKNTGE